jgi:phosphomannomutase
MSATGKKSPFGAYDIRGVYGENLDEEFARNLGVALHEHIGVPNGDFVIGYDVRTSSPLLAKSLAEGIASCGGNVTILDVASTPRVYWHGAEKKFDCSIAVTASHLPAKHNGFKICRENAIPISSEDGLVDIKQRLDVIAKQSNSASQISNSASRISDSASRVSNVGSNKAVGKITTDSSGFASYIESLRSFLKISNKIKIVVDAGGSPVGREVAQLFENTNASIVPLGFEEDPSFSRRSANPIDEGALTELSQVVLKEKAVFGAAFDGDGDRVVFVDEQGVMIDPDLITALLAEQILSTSPISNIMFDLRSSRAVKERIEACGGTALKSRVGHSFIKADMRRQNVSLAGELSAHYYWGDLFYTDNAVRALIEIANLLSERSVPLSSLITPLQKHVGTGEINFKTTESAAVIDALKQKFSASPLDFTDGLTVEFSDWWFNVRTSQTEPLVRLCVGAVDEATLSVHRKELESLITEAMKAPVAR